MFCHKKTLQVVLIRKNFLQHIDIYHNTTDLLLHDLRFSFFWVFVQKFYFIEKNGTKITSLRKTSDKTGDREVLSDDTGLSRSY